MRRDDRKIQNFTLMNEERINLQYLEDLTKENKCIIDSIKWVSMINSYIEFDSKPFSEDNFKIEVQIKGEENYINFINYLFHKKLHATEQLYNMCEVVE